MNKSEFVESIQFNYMFDFDWLSKQYPAENRPKPITLVFDQRSEKELKQKTNMYGDAYDIRLIKVCISYLIKKGLLRLILKTLMDILFGMK